jgi:hypothetical protein
MSFHYTISFRLLYNIVAPLYPLYLCSRLYGEHIYHAGGHGQLFLRVLFRRIIINICHQKHKIIADKTKQAAMQSPQGSHVCPALPAWWKASHAAKGGTGRGTRLRWFLSGRPLMFASLRSGARSCNELRTPNTYRHTLADLSVCLEHV